MTMLSRLRSFWRPVAVLALAAALLSGTWPALEIHSHADTGKSMVATADHHHEQADTWGDRDGLHIHACACAAHCSALPAARTVIGARASCVGMTNHREDLASGVS
ncbi:hypothetical protein RM531_03320 [Salinisphaera sp. P385]|uniref:DUF2946 domain-containing protein n=1 Tax=Spectribacter acetivorans TaxID=3075603 RepID=A0ABU3B942_9GAMM|nr:hypothetical protein [Salinisphaera sp. P385]MDT0617491.1 hypothetical protein [Salinisphaera sp. P385]